MTDYVQEKINTVLNEIKTYEEKISYYRKEIERAEKTLSELLEQKFAEQYKVVKRLARAGDTIMITKDDFTGTGRYKVGDIYKVLARFDSRVFIDKTDKHTDDNIRVLDYDYVVLEAIDE